MLQEHFTKITITRRCQCQQQQKRFDIPAKRLQWSLRCDRRRQSVPGTCSRHREGAVTECWTVRWWHDQRWRSGRPETPTNFDTGRLTEGEGWREYRKRKRKEVCKSAVHLTCRRYDPWQIIQQAWYRLKFNSRTGSEARNFGTQRNVTHMVKMNENLDRKMNTEQMWHQCILYFIIMIIKKTIKILCILLMNYDFLFVSIFNWKFTPATKWIEVII